LDWLAIAAAGLGKDYQVIADQTGMAQRCERAA